MKINYNKTVDIVKNVLIYIKEIINKMLKNKKEYNKLQKLYEQLDKVYALDFVRIHGKQSRKSRIEEEIENHINICKITATTGKEFYFRHSSDNYNLIDLTTKNKEDILFSFSKKEAKNLFNKLGKFLEIKKNMI